MFLISKHNSGHDKEWPSLPSLDTQAIMKAEVAARKTLGIPGQSGTGPSILIGVCPLCIGKVFNTQKFAQTTLKLIDNGVYGTCNVYAHMVCPRK
jgi:hypothetical protein